VLELFDSPLQSEQLGHWRSHIKSQSRLERMNIIPYYEEEVRDPSHNVIAVRPMILSLSLARLMKYWRN